MPRHPTAFVPTPSSTWRAHFHQNRGHFEHIPWGACGLSPEEIAAIRHSIAEFQLGESSEGRYLIQEAKRHAERIGDHDYAAAMGYFIAEENSHARALGRFMDAVGLPRCRKIWTDTVFRWMRRGMGLEVSVSVLITAELIAQVYYEALRDATHSPALREICAQILRDEAVHIRFQSERLAILGRERVRTGLRLALWARRLLLAGTIPVVWYRHRAVLRRGGFGWRKFCRACWNCHAVSEALSQPMNYDWNASGFGPALRQGTT